MLRTSLVFEDGSILSSGPEEGAVIRKITLTQKVNSETELTLGSVCSAMLEAEIFTPYGEFVPETGTRVTLYRDDIQMGVFLLEKPTRASANVLRLTAYDRVSLLDRDLSTWLSELAGWPYSLYKFAWMVCAQCGLELENKSLPNGDYLVEKFSARGVTGRQLLRWVGEAAGRYCIATAQGNILFDWYTPAELDSWYYADTLHYEDYTVAPVQRIQISQTAQDVGLLYPENTTGNTYKIQGNYLLTGTEGLESVAQTLLAQMGTVEYTPCKLTLPASAQARAGQILQITDPNGESISCLVMSRVQSGQKDSLECTGSASRDSISAVNQQSFRALTGRVLELQTRVEGLTVENRDAQNNAADLQLTVEQIRTQVQQQEQSIERITTLEQTATTLGMAVTAIQSKGASRVETTTGFTFDENGLTVEKTGSDIKNYVNQEGMRVLRGDQQVLLRADAEGVLATDVTVNNYLVVGDHARFEDYPGGRTACYHIGG